MGKISWNHNLVVTFVFRITFSLSQGLWNSGVGSTYIYYLEDKRNTLVGLVQGIQGICIPLASLPGGYIADRTRRDTVLRAFGVAGFLAIILSIAAVLAPKQPLPWVPSIDLKFGLLCVGYCFWGGFQAGSSIVESILADSVPTGGRSGVYTSLFFLGTSSRAIGPLLAVLIFMVDGNVWRVSTLGKVMIAGMLASIVPVISLFCFDDNKSLGAESEAHGRVVEQAGSQVFKDEDAPAASSQALHKPRFWGLSQAAIPYILATSDLIYGLASGCTIKFFPIFFASEVHLNPVAVNILMGAQPIVIACFATAGQQLSVHIGRIQVLLLLRLFGFSIMGVMGLFTSWWRNGPLIVTLFLLRTGVNNAGYPIQKAVLMDHVPKKSRGRWSAVDSIAIFGWSGSAFLGGILVDRAGFDWCFLITAIAQAAGWAVLFPLLGLVPRKEVANEATRADVNTPLLDPESCRPGEDSTGPSDEAPGPDLHAQVAALRADLQGVAAEGPRRVDTKRAPDKASGQQPGRSRSGDDEEFVAMLGSLKSPRRSIDSWADR